MQSQEMGKTSKLESQWSLGWGNQKKEPTLQNSPKIVKYHNESKIQFQDKVKVAEQHQMVKKEQKRKNQEFLNEKLPTYDPRQGGKSSIFFGDEKTDYRKKDQVFTNQNMRNNQKGKSQIQFG